MPSKTNFLYRMYCKKCKDFTIHERIFQDEVDNPLYHLVTFIEDKTYGSMCECKAQYTSVLISEIDEDKLITQRNRFKQKRSEDIKNTLNRMMITYNPFEGLFNNNIGIKTKIIESDAGLEQIEAKQKEEAEAIKIHQRNELDRFRDINRNDTCLCGSGMKYKKCCLTKHYTY